MVHWTAYRRCTSHAAHYAGPYRAGTTQTVHRNQGWPRIAAIYSSFPITTEIFYAHEYSSIGYFGIQGRARLHDAARFRARSTSHPVAALGGCTKIPLAAGWAQEDENHSLQRRFKPWLQSDRPPGSARTDQVLVDYTIRSLRSSGRLHHGAFDHDAGGDIFPERDEQLSRQCHDRRLLKTATIAFDPFLKPQGER